ncbi:uncharacterized protein SPSK_01499 [Sporothrix schenckii 1099-18]|uniref:Uncharacterized protein n=1 Tax=Sporothrix schenckii 1099-18 TaxID=1397361 RepID=A0A0F2MBU8_SPOSC|nr:uncharacterized protein SPSK_01499 [Sporothrix schenckii 1099-18]KJR87178.1 hypothetical protein SPSK_01499 [Sporothrix schenckii 1099-18]
MSCRDTNFLLNPLLALLGTHIPGGAEAALVAGHKGAQQFVFARLGHGRVVVLDRRRARDQLGPVDVQLAAAEDKAGAVGGHSGPEQQEKAHGQHGRVRQPSRKQADQQKEDGKGQHVRHGLDQHGAAVGKDEVGGGLAGRVGAQEQVKGVLAGAVQEVVAAVPRDGDLAVAQGADLGASAEARHVRLHGAGARIALGDAVGVVGPQVAEEHLKGRVLVHQRAAAGHDAEIGKHALEGPAGQHALDDVGAVEAVHAVGAHDRRLHGAGLQAGGHATVAGQVRGAEVLLSDEGIVHLVEQQLGAVEALALGLAVEIKVDVVHAVQLALRVLLALGETAHAATAAGRGGCGGRRGGPVEGVQLLAELLAAAAAAAASGGAALEELDHALVGLLDAALAALLVDEVDEVVVAVDAHLFGEVGAGGRKGGLDAASIAAHLQTRRVLEVVDLAPEDGHAAPGLHVRQDLGLGAGGFVARIAHQLATRLHVAGPRVAGQVALAAVVEDDNLLGLVVVGHMAILVDAAGEKTRAGAEARAAGDERNGQRPAAEGGRVDLEHAEHDGQDVGVDAGLDAELAAGAAVAVLDKVRLHKAVPEEAVVGAHPERGLGLAGRARGVLLRDLALEAVGEVEGVGEVHGAGLQKATQQTQEAVLVRVAQLALVDGQDIDLHNAVDHVALEAADVLVLGDDDDVLVQAQLDHAEDALDAEDARHTLARQKRRIVETDLTGRAVDGQGRGVGRGRRLEDIGVGADLDVDVAERKRHGGRCGGGLVGGGRTTVDVDVLC